MTTGAGDTPRPRPRRGPGGGRGRGRRPGLLDGVDEVVEPFVRWGALGIGATAAVLAIGVVVLGLVTGEPFLVPLALVPAALAVGGYLRWSGRLRP